MCKGNREYLSKATAKPNIVRHFLQHRWRFGIFAGIATIGVEKFLFEAITKHEHLTRSEVPIHIIADIAWCFLWEKWAWLLKKKWISEKYSIAISLIINGLTHGMYELWHNALHAHTYEHGNNSDIMRLFALVTAKIIWEQLYHNQEHINLERSTRKLL